MNDHQRHHVRRSVLVAGMVLATFGLGVLDLVGWIPPGSPPEEGP